MSDSPADPTEEERKARRWRVFRNVRIAILLSILVIVTATIELRLHRLRSWNRVLVVGVYPVAASQDAAVQAHLKTLREQDFAPVVAFLEREARRYGKTFTSPLVQFQLSAPLPEEPPRLPENPGPFDVIRWSLALRVYSFRMHQAHQLPDADVELYLLFHPSGSPRALDTSLAISRLRMAIVHGEADPRASSWLQVAVAHELLHMATASDKYDDHGMPVHPDGFGEPDLSPRFPQNFCEIMAGQVPVDAGHFREPRGLDECLIGPRTAAEVGLGR